MIFFDFQKEIVQRRRQMGLTEAEAGERAGKNGDFWRQIEGRKNLSVSVLAQAVHALGGHLEIVWDGKVPDAEPTYVSELFGKYRFTNPEDAMLALALAERAFEAGRIYEISRGRF